jgi:hypothetical protein
VAVKGEEVGFRPVTLPDLETAGLDLRGMALAKLRGETVIPLDQRDAPRGRVEDVRGECAHAGPHLDKMVARLRVETGDDGLGQVRIKEEILPEHLARPHTDLLESGAKFCFGHGKIHKALRRLVPAVIGEEFFPFVPKLFTGGEET